MSAVRVLVELLKAIPDVVRAFRPKKPLPPRVDVRPISTYPSATIITEKGERRDF